MYDKLIEKLRDDSILENCEFDFVHKYMHKAADAIEELQAYVALYKDCGETAMKAANDYKARIEELQKQLREEKVDNVNLTGWLAEEHAKHRWIPVAERLPNCNGCYLVWRPHFFGGEIGMPSICYFDGSNTWHDSYGVDFERILSPEDVTHWMPLPQPPKDGES